MDWYTGERRVRRMETNLKLVVTTSLAPKE
jgi:hypothetical protein